MMKGKKGLNSFTFTSQLSSPHFISDIHTEHSLFEYRSSCHKWAYNYSSFGTVRKTFIYSASIKMAWCLLETIIAKHYLLPLTTFSSRQTQEMSSFFSASFLPHILKAQFFSSNAVFTVQCRIQYKYIHDHPNVMLFRTTTWPFTCHSILMIHTSACSSPLLYDISLNNLPNSNTM